MGKRRQPKARKVAVRCCRLGIRRRREKVRTVNVIRPQANLDVSGSAALEKQLTGLEGDVLIDLADVNFVASSGLRVMLKAAQGLKAHGGSLSVSNANDTILQVFRISGFAMVVDIQE